MRNLATLLALIFTTALSAQDITGRWVTIDDNTGKRRSVVEITLKNGKASGRIVEIFDKSKVNNTCEVCTDDRKGKRVLGMEIIRDMEKDGDEWEDGTILDPDNGKVYDCKLWVENGRLMVRGYVAFFFRTQTWVRE
ncbi:MAG: DUF2147 domain-containing protein [Flavobacteriales bacterium]|jgi:uncharacterized protein (DUF2147 family)|nr:MAG: DUF2147 domain-containing protein [Flavobacteriales bacterium]